jgi:Ner family transcriptional regulator
MPTWDRPRIKAEVERKGSTLRALAIAVGLSRAACSNALRRRHRSAEEAIAAFLDIPVWELWPDRWVPPAAVGLAPTRIDNRTAENRIKPRRRHRQKIGRS